MRNKKFPELPPWVIEYNWDFDHKVTRINKMIGIRKAEYKIGAKAICVRGRFKGKEGVISYFNPDGHEDAFCMRVYPDVGERVNPGNWEIEPNIILPVCPVNADGEPLLPNNIL